MGGIAIAGGGTVHNSGLIETTTLQGNGVSLENGGTVINAGSTGIYGDFSGVAVYGGAGLITNSAVIDAIGLNSYGVYLAAGGTVTNTAQGSIIGHLPGRGSDGPSRDPQQRRLCLRRQFRRVFCRRGDGHQSH